jgi:hypothetical protein
MPINTNLNRGPWNDDFDINKQFYRVLFKPRFAVQARELTQLQTILQNQIEQFGDNIFQEGSIIKGCNFTELNDLQFVKLIDRAGFDVLEFTPRTEGENDEIDVFFEIEGKSTGLKAAIIAATRGFQTRPPDLNTFYINYLNSNVIDEVQRQIFEPGEELIINKITVFNIEDEGQVIEQVVTEEVGSIFVTEQSNHAGRSFGLIASEGVVFQKGHFLFADEQLVIVSKYDNLPDGVSVGYVIDESIITALQDSSLFDNAAGSPNENAPGADRLKLSPRLVTIPTEEADDDTLFFSLRRYENGVAVQIRDVSQYNVIGEEMARRTYEESGNYIVSEFNVRTIERNGQLKVSVGPGIAYVRGYRVENKGELILDVGQVTTTEFQENQPVSMKYGSYIDVLEATGVLPVGNFDRVDLLDSSNNSIGSAIITNYTPDKLFLFDYRLDANTSASFSDIARVSAGNNFAVVANNSVTPTIKDINQSAFVFDTGVFSIKETDDVSLPARDSRTFSGVASSISILAVANEDFDVPNDDILVIDGNNQQIEVTSVVLSSDKKALTINIGANNGSGTVYFNKRFQIAEPHTKESKELYVRLNYTAPSPLSNGGDDFNSDFRYNLGFPDVYEIVSVTDSSGVDVTQSFRLVTNQKDNYYDHSYIEQIAGRQLPVGGELVVRMKAFRVNRDVGKYFFTASSYEDVTPDKIPLYTSKSGRIYNLRDCLDFRPHVDPLGSYGADSPTNASIITEREINLVPQFTGNILIPALGTSARMDYEYFLNRTDVLAIDSYGKFALIKGEETVVSRPQDAGDKLIIAELYIPSFPALTPENASRTNRRQYAAKIKSRGVKTYTMKDIDRLSKNIQRLSYYATVSALELSTQNLNILDSGGLSRFKNGIIVDPFTDLSIADVQNPEFSAAVDFTEKTLMPAVRTFPMNLVVENTSNATIFPDTDSPEIATISRESDVSIISQRYATNFRNCVSNFYSYRATGFIFPEYDGAYDVINTPDTNIDIDFVTPFADFVDNIQEFVPLTSTRTEFVSSSREAVGSNTTTSGKGKNARTAISTTFETTEIWADITRTLQVLAGRTNEQRIGDFVTNFQFNPFMRSREINVIMFGLRPNTRHFVFFDEVNVDANCAPGTIESTARDVQRAGSFGDPIISNANGVASVVFKIPENTFFVGDRKFEMADVSIYENIGSASTSKGFIMYRAYNFSIEKSGAVISTRQPEFNVEETTTFRNVVNRQVVTQQIYRDPIAQTFFVKQAMGRGSDTVFASKVDLYFRRRSDINGVTVMLREVINGYPSAEIIPFSKVHLTPELVEISENGSIPTTIFFKTPIRLDVEKEYVIVVEPDAADPDYLIYTSKVGGTDLASGNVVVQDWGDGVLFTSTNNRAWQSYQDEDLKFTLYRHEFDTQNATVTLKNDNHEFLSIGNLNGKFNDGEIVYSVKGSDFNVSVQFGSSVLGGTISGINNGDFILLEFLNQKIIARIVENAGFDSTGNPIVIIDRPSTFKTVGNQNYTGNVVAKPIVKGTIIYYNFRNPVDMILEASSARTGRVFQNSDVILGLDSGASATISSVDNIMLSYLQPMLSRTTDSVSTVELSGVFTDPLDTNVSYSKGIAFNDKTAFNNRGMRLLSKSSNIDNTSPFRITATLDNDQNTTSTPFFDVETAMMFAYQYKISNESETTSKYISRVIELTENFDSEDFRIYLTGYKPSNTDIKVYIKVQNVSDPITFESNPWIELESLDGQNIFSSSSNLNDFKEFVYNVPQSAKNSGVITYTNSSGTYEGYRRFAIKIELLSENGFNVPRVSDYRGIALI